MKNLSVSKKLIVGFGIVIVLAVLTGMVGIFGMNSINTGTNTIALRANVGILMGDLTTTIRETQSVYRKAALHAALDQKTDFDAEIAAVPSTLSIVEELDSLIITPSVRDKFNDMLAVKKSYDSAKEVYETELNAALNEKDTSRSTQMALAAMSNFAGPMLNYFTSADNLSSFCQTLINDGVVEANNTFVMMLTISIVILAVSVIAAVIIGIAVSKSISNPLTLLSVFMQKAGSTGDLTLSPEDVRNIENFSDAKDEIGSTIGSASIFVGRITEISKQLTAISDGDLTQEIKLLSEQDTMGMALKNMLENLNSMFSEINTSSEQVSSGSQQIASGAQLLASGSTEQAATIQELSSSISEISTAITEASSSAQKAAELANEVKGKALQGSDQMTQMMVAVGEINDASQNISKVIKVIDDIAFQTNILALNAAVEAARAGSAGKGFAVVAEEVRSLAAKSAEAAKETGALIESSISKAGLGVKIAQGTSESLKEIVDGIMVSSQISSEIAQSTSNQSSAIAQINVGIDQVAQVVQQNSATAEESAAASEELSGQSDMLRQLIAQFKLKDGGKMYRSLPPANKSAQKRHSISMPDEDNLSFDTSGRVLGKY
ncbi:MAG: methyl-accepting chemotaxis protein [Oscillospiraceae bacterium]|jgi:methyl-accepting chemotaxis protein|nr:methyl-accepting chemotaxis protein [Oscillospiraceae bacterium]